MTLESVTIGAGSLKLQALYDYNLSLMSWGIENTGPGVSPIQGNY